MQGGGHSPATHDFGLGADQVLEAKIVLASGRVVTANACQNPDLLFAIRGGGPSTYGVVVSTIIKAHPATNVTAQTLGFAPLTANDTDTFMDAVAVIPQAYPSLSDSGFSGYGSWSIYSPTPTLANYSIGYVHTIANFGKSKAQAQSLFASTASKLGRLNGSLFLTIEYYDLPSYSDYYTRFSNITTPVGETAALGSRLLDRKALTSNVTALKKTLHILADTPSEATSNNVVFAGGGQVFSAATIPCPV